MQSVAVSVTKMNYARYPQWVNSTQHLTVPDNHLTYRHSTLEYTTHHPTWTITCRLSQLNPKLCTTFSCKVLRVGMLLITWFSIGTKITLLLSVGIPVRKSEAMSTEMMSPSWNLLIQLLPIRYGFIHSNGSEEYGWLSRCLWKINDSFLNHATTSCSLNLMFIFSHLIN